VISVTLRLPNISRDNDGPVLCGNGEFGGDDQNDNDDVSK
jgi:hypothetical protein